MQYIAIHNVYNMYRRVMAIFLQYDVRLILLVELPAHDLLCTCIMRAFTAFKEILTKEHRTQLTKLYVQQIQLLKMRNVCVTNLLIGFLGVGGKINSHLNRDSVF